MKQATSLFVAFAVLTAMAAPAAAYVGPGAGISLLGALWGLVVAIAMAVGFVLFWPLRKMLRRRKQRGAASASAQSKRDATADTQSS